MSERIDDLDGDPEGELYHDAEAEGPGDDASAAEDGDSEPAAAEEQPGEDAEPGQGDG